MYEAELVTKIAQHLEKMGYKVVERSPIPYENFWSKEFKGLPKSSRKCWFDLVVTHKDTHDLMGVECKTNTDLGSLHSAIGECLDYLTIRGIKSAIIVLPSLEPTRRKRLESLISRFNLPLELMEF